MTVTVEEASIVGDIEKKKLYVTSDKDKDELLKQIEKTGKAVTYVGAA